MKVKITKLAATLLVSVFIFYSCQKDSSTDPPVKQEITFSFEQKDIKTTSSKGIDSKEDAKYLVVTIENSLGDKVYETKQLDLINFNGSFISQSLSLEVDISPYKLTQFFVLDANSNVIYATPMAGSSLAHLVANPLAISFNVSKDLVTKVVPEVVSTEGNSAKDFGYVSIDFTVVSTIRFFSGVQVYNQASANLELTTASVLIKGNPGNAVLYSGSITAKTDSIKVKDGYNEYIISFSKAGYNTKDTTLTNDGLKIYLSTPLLIVLNKCETISDIDGNLYKTVQIGTQFWMAENLKTTRYSNNDLIETTTPASLDISAETTPKYQWAFNGYENNVVTYGRLYTWYAATDSRNVCPTGWHLPSAEEWGILRDFVGGENVAGGKLKETGLTHWANPNVGASNETGFTGLPAGFRVDNGRFIYFSVNGFFHLSSKHYLDNSSYHFALNSWNQNAYYLGFSNSKNAISVRCIKN